MYVVHAAEITMLLRHATRNRQRRTVHVDQFNELGALIRVVWKGGCVGRQLI